VHVLFVQGNFMSGYHTLIFHVFFTGFLLIGHAFVDIHVI
jgi:hypothetical protein